MKIVVGRDKLDEIQVFIFSPPLSIRPPAHTRMHLCLLAFPLQGVRHKIQAFETFLDKYPEFQQQVHPDLISSSLLLPLVANADSTFYVQVVLIQVALQTTESNELAGGVADLVSHINSRFSTLTYQPVVFLHTQDLTFSQYLALLTVADAFLVTSLREGMALR